MSVMDVIASRRSIKNFTDRAITNEEIERLLGAVCCAPNHRMTEPWRFYVLGPEGRAAYGKALGMRKAKRVEDPEAAQAVIDKVSRVHRDLPGMLLVAIAQDENPEIKEEDYAAAWMGIQNLSLAACEMGLGTHLKSGAIMDDPNARGPLGVPDSERIIACIELGEPAETPAGKARCAASDFTTWVP
ncbi:MAG: nitroreductase family protein [Longimicrobiales bacterium]|jgi:nitroreductase